MFDEREMRAAEELYRRVHGPRTMGRPRAAIEQLLEWVKLAGFELRKG